MSLRVNHSGKLIFRWILVGTVLCIAICPALPLVVSTLGQESTRPVWTDAFSKSLQNSLGLAAGVSLLSLAIGLPLGLLASLYRFPARASLVLFQALPLLLPSFLLCIGWSNLAARIWLSWLPTPDGLPGCVFVLGLQMVPLPFFATWAACQNLTASQIDAARLHGGEKSVLKLAALACAPVAILAALLSGILSLSDAGAPLIFGCRCVAVEIRTSFSALYDFELAGRQCLLLAGLVLLLAAPVLLVGLRWLAAAVLALQTRPATPFPHRALSWLAAAGLLSVLVVGIVLPAFGLCLPAMQNPMMERAWTKVGDTTNATLIFAVGAAIIAVTLATVLALAVSGNSRARLTVLAVMLAILAMPPALAAIGVARLATQAPPQFDWLMRSELTVALVLGLRFLPVATIALMRAEGSLPRSWNDAAHVHGVNAPRYFALVILPNLIYGIVVGLLLVMVLAAADITTTHLLQPPGSQSLPVAIFTVMANSPEGLVASLCLLYLLCIVILFLATAQLAHLWSRRAT